MNWLETIELRTSLNKYESAKKTIDLLLIDLNNKNKVLKIVNYNHLTLYTDFSIHVIHNGEKINKAGSDTALTIISCLEEYGCVNHNIWIEAKSK